MQVQDRANSFEQEDLRVYQAAAEGRVRLALGDVAFLEVTGDDRKGWLQGQATNDLRSFVPGSLTHFCICKPTGQIVAPASAWALESSMVLSVPAATVPAVLERFETMVIMEDVAVRLIAPTGFAVSVQGPLASEWLSERLDLPTMDSTMRELDGEPVYCLRANRTGLGGWDLVFPNGPAKRTAKWFAQLDALNGAAFEALRLEAGLPTWGADYGERTLPPEMGPLFESRYVSYTKGCYTGQEVLMRIFSRGHTNKTWCGLRSPVPLVAGATLSSSAGQAIGVVTSAAFSPELGHIGAAMLRKEGQTLPSRVRLGEVDLEVRRMPLMA